MAHIGQEAALGGVGTISLYPRFLYFGNRGLQLGRHVVERRRQLAEFIARENRYAVLEISATDPDGAFAQTPQRFVGMAGQQEAEQRGALDTVGAWIEECCTPGSQYFSPFAKLYGSYNEWAKENGVEPKRQKSFSASLQHKGYQSDRSTVQGKTQRGFYGLQVNELIKAAAAGFGQVDG